MITIIVPDWFVYLFIGGMLLHIPLLAWDIYYRYKLIQLEKLTRKWGIPDATPHINVTK